MRGLGHEQFFAAGHDRGLHVALRLAMDYPQAVRGWRAGRDGAEANAGYRRAIRQGTPEHLGYITQCSFSFIIQADRKKEAPPDVSGRASCRAWPSVLEKYSVSGSAL